MSLAHLFLAIPVSPKLITLLCIIVAIKILTPILIPKIKGWIGEKSTGVIALRKLDPSTYRIINDFYLPRPDGKGTTQIDHAIFSPFGIFVIETKNYKGWIFGSEKQRQWTQSLYKKKHKFQNPLHQNDLHIRALAEFLELPKGQFHSVVFFIGESTFKTELPENVLDRGLITFIKSFQTPMIAAAPLQASIAKLNAHVKGYDRQKLAREHVRALKARTAG